MRRLRLISVLFLAALGLGAGLSFGAVPAERPVELIMNEDLIRTLRDPFEVPVIAGREKTKPESDLEIYQLRELRLNGVITGPKKPRAMVSSPKGRTYFVKVGDPIGAREGRVSLITPDAIRVVEFYVDESGKRTPEMYEMRMDGEVRPLDRKDRN